MRKPFMPPRGGVGSQGRNETPVPSALWQPPEAVEASDFYRLKRGSFFLGFSGQKPVGVADDRHVMVWAGARGGKTSTVLKTNLRLYGGAMLVTDPKSELAEATAEWRAKVLGQKVYVLDPWGEAKIPHELRAQFNPLEELYLTWQETVAAGRKSSVVDDVSLLCEALIPAVEDAKAQHWTDSARFAVRGISLWQMFVAPEEWRGLHKLPQILAEAMTKGDDDENDFFATLANVTASESCPKAIAEVIATTGAGMMRTPAGERASILSTARNQLGFLESEQMAETFGGSSFRLSDLKRAGNAQPVTIYLCLPASRMGTHAKWLRLLLNMTIATLERVKDKPELPVMLMLEEFAALGHMRPLEQAAAYMAGFGVRMVSVLQDLSQLKRHYREGWESFLANAGTVLAFANSDGTTTDWISKQLGQTFVYLHESQQQGIRARGDGAAVSRENFQKVPLLAPDEIRLQFGRRYMRGLVMVADGDPIVVDRHHLSDTETRSLLEWVK